MFEKIFRERFYKKRMKRYQPDRKRKIVSSLIKRGTLFLMVTAVLVFGFAIIWLNRNPSLQDVWKNFIADKKVPVSFCETTNIHNPVRQPLNAFSSIIYLLTAIVILKNCWKKIEGSTPKPENAYCALFGLILLYVFCASAFYHASLINLAHKLDYSAVFAFSVFPVLYFLYHRWLNRSKLPVTQKWKSIAQFFLAFLAINLLLNFLTPNGKETMTASILVLLFFALAAATLIAEPDNPKRNWLILSVVSVLVAVVWFEFDKYKILCNTNSFLQPHGLWNLFVGLSAFYFFLYMRSEHNPTATFNFN